MPSHTTLRGYPDRPERTDCPDFLRDYVDDVVVVDRELGGGGREAQRTVVLVGGGQRSAAAGLGHVLREIEPASGRLSVVLISSLATPCAPV